MTKLYPMTEAEREYATANHGLIFNFLSFKGLDLDTYYDIVVFGYLGAVQRYLNDPDLQLRLPFKTVANRVMKDALGEHRKSMGRQKRKACVISLDNTVLENGAAIANIIHDPKIDATEATTRQMLEDIDQYLTVQQRRYLRLRLHGYTAKEISRLAQVKAKTVHVNFARMREQIPARCVL